MSSPQPSEVLDHKPLPAASYNELPDGATAFNNGFKHFETMQKLFEMIESAGLKKVFGVNVMHKHCGVEEGLVMVHETAVREDRICGVFRRPRKPETFPNLRGYFFRACAPGKMEAYEYTTDPSWDISPHTAFISKFADEILRGGCENVFGLTVRSTVFQEHKFEEPYDAVTIPTEAPEELYDRITLPVPSSPPTEGELADDEASYFTNTKSEDHSPVDAESSNTPIDKTPKAAPNAARKNARKTGSMLGRKLGRKLHHKASRVGKESKKTNKANKTKESNEPNESEESEEISEDEKSYASDETNESDGTAVDEEPEGRIVMEFDILFVREGARAGLNEGFTCNEREDGTLGWYIVPMGQGQNSAPNGAPAI